MTDDIDPSLSGDLRAAVHDLEWLGNRFRGLLALSAKAERLVAVMDDEDILRRRNEDLRRQAEPIKELIASADHVQRRLDEANAELARHRDNMEEARKRVLEEAGAAAESIIADGRAEAEKIIADGRAKAATEAEGQTAEARRRQKTLDGLNTEIVTRNAEIARRQEELDRINAEIAKLRAKIGVS
jgi:chromosome segregation ATPase